MLKGKPSFRQICPELSVRMARVPDPTLPKPTIPTRTLRTESSYNLDRPGRAGRIMSLTDIYEYAWFSPGRSLVSSLVRRAVAGAPAGRAPGGAVRCPAAE